MKFEPKYTISDKIRANLQEIERLKNIVKGHYLLPEAEASIRLRATVDTVHSSTSIEGNPLNANEVRSVITSEPKLSKKEYAEIEVQNYKRALEYIDERRVGAATLSTEDILALHGLITSRLLDKTRSGHFRNSQVYIENQNHETVYDAAPSEDILGDIEALLDWANSNHAIIPMPIIAGVLHYQLVTIHPFVDGNGRTARALALLYLSINRYDCDGSLSLDSYYASDKRAYYDILQQTHGENYAKSMNADLTCWLEYFTDGFLTSLHVLDAELRILDLLLPMSGRLDREEQDILSFIAKFGSIEISEAEAILPETNRRSIQRRLKKMVEDGIIELIGSTHDAKYVLKNRK